MRQQWKLISVACTALITGALVAGVVMTLPQGLRNSDAYAQQVATAEAARGNLQTAQDLSSAFRNVADALRPSVVSVRVTKKGRVVNGPVGADMGNLPPELRRFFGENGMVP